MTNNDPTARIIAATDRALNANAIAAARRAAETNAMTFVPADAPRITGKFRTARRSTRRTIR